VGHAKVGDLDTAAVLRPEQISGLDVAVDDALVVDWKATDKRM
jgi:hypothetical protein